MLRPRPAPCQGAARAAGAIVRRVSTVLTPEGKERWDTDGWCVVPAVIPPDQLAAAQDAVHRYFPTPAEVGAGDAEASRWHTWDASWPEFPFHSSRLNALVVHDNVVDLAEGLLGSRDLALYMGLVTAKYAGPALGLQPAPARRLPQSHVGRTPARARLPASRVLRLPHRRHHRGRSDPVRLVAKDQGHPRGAAHAELRGLRRALRRPVGCGGTGRLRGRLPPRRVPPLGGLHRPLPLPGHAPRLVPPPRRRLGRLPGLAPPRLLLRALQVRPAGHAAPAGAPGRARAGPPYWNEATLAGMQGRYPGLDMAPWRDALR